jgi:hypothetical protein
MDTPRVMIVQIGTRSWTLEALHCACWIARQTGEPIALVKMIPVRYQSWLGTPWGNLEMDRQEQKELLDYQATIEDYGVAYTLTMFQYDSWVDATAQLANVLHAGRIFAQPPTSRMHVWEQVQTWSLQRQLKRQGCEWIQQLVYGDSLGIPLQAEVSF